MQYDLQMIASKTCMNSSSFDGKSNKNKCQNCWVYFKHVKFMTQNKYLCIEAYYTKKIT